MEMTALAPFTDRLAGRLSGGMKQKLGLACTLVRAPDLLLLDEPTVGVDPQSRERIVDAVRAEATRGAAVLFSTHYLEEAERVCDRVVLIDHGRVIALGTPAALVQELGEGLRLTVVTREPLPAGWLDGAPAACIAGAPAVTTRGHAAQITLPKLADAAIVLQRATATGGDVLELHLHQTDLQDVFLRLTGRELRD
jgi:ABC-2 type transport system ATP-binding protein